MRAPPSYCNGFAPRDGIPRYPSLWRGCVGAWAPCLGPTGAQLMDWSGRRGNGAITNATLDTLWAVNDGRFCLSPDANNDTCTIATPTPLNIGTSGDVPLAICFWCTVNTSAAGTNGMLSNSRQFGRHTLTIRRKASTSQIEVLAQHNFATTVTLTTTASLNDGKWHHIAYVLNSYSDRQLWVDGKLDVSDATALTPSGSNTDAAFSILKDGTGTWSGLADDFRFYSSNVTRGVVQMLASRRGIAYELDDSPMWRAADVTGGSFQAYWARRQSQFIGGGLM